MAEQYSVGGESSPFGMGIQAIQEGLTLPQQGNTETPAEAPIMMTMEQALAGHEPLPVMEDENIQDLPALVEFLEGEAALGPGTILVLDFDGTTVKMQNEILSALAGRPNEMHADSIMAIEKAIAAGCKISIASNQPEALHSIIRKYASFNDGYTYFPQGARDRKVEVFIGKSGGELAVGHRQKYKATDKAVEDVHDWIMKSEDEGGAGFDVNNGVVIMVGDRTDTDFDYFARLNDRIQQSTGNEANTLAFKFPDMGIIKQAKQYTGFGSNMLQRLVSKIP